MSFDWTDAAIAELRRLRAEGLSFSICADALGRQFGVAVSRNACIGKAGRLGVPGNKRPVARPRAAAKRKVPTVRNFLRSLPVKSAAPIETVSAEATELPPDQSPFAVRLLELNEGHCRWPLGDPREADFMFCGAAPIECRPYCLRHCRLAYAPPRERADEARRDPSRRVAA